MEPWWHEVVSLIASSKVSEAVQLTAKAAANGSLAAKVRLARFGSDAGLTEDEADQIVDSAGSSVTDGDATAHWVLWGAYDLGLGTCEYEEKSRKVLHHLQLYATLTGDPLAVIAVARNWANGRIGVKADVLVAAEWYHFADALGHPDAPRELAKLLRNARGSSPQ